MAGMGCLMLGQPPAVTPTLQGDVPLGFGSTHPPKTSLASGQGLHGARRPSASRETSPQRCLCPEMPSSGSSGGRIKGFYTLFWGYLLEANVLPHIWVWRSRLWPGTRG